ncbi:hypothetical protein [Phaeobacter inhibens]|uniref:hypothetical protein n=1 Tax=Phaeobacter inhibens TaxID=221822 RepID=UPI0021A57282|nr:hypothetical protein [Phaeobacter inhibens]UWS06739.1 hypothetical protein K4K98_10760 [Phaeobacter inhibens]
MLNADGIFIFDNPAVDTIHDACHTLEVDTGDCYTVVYRRDVDGWGFDLMCLGSRGDRLIGRSSFSFKTKSEATEWLEPQVPKIKISK